LDLYTAVLQVNPPAVRDSSAARYRLADPDFGYLTQLCHRTY